MYLDRSAVHRAKIMNAGKLWFVGRRSIPQWVRNNYPRVISSSGPPCLVRERDRYPVRIFRRPTFRGRCNPSSSIGVQGTVESERRRFVGVLRSVRIPKEDLVRRKCWYLLAPTIHSSSCRNASPSPGLTATRPGMSRDGQLGLGESAICNGLELKYRQPLPASMDTRRYEYGLLAGSIASAVSAITHSQVSAYRISEPSR